MKLLDRIALQRLVSMLLTFIITVIKLFVPEPTGDDTITPEPEKKRRLPWRRKK